ncbi:MAG TPA: hypothetical protein VJU78_07220 [Chitinophagaceae bacterium]|nr:hypothetical protein [Chitinophagaceae bacterium]
MPHPIGSIFPDSRYAQLDGAFICFSENSFDVVVLMAGINPSEIEDFKRGKLVYGLFVVDYIPFFILDFGNDLNLDCSFNFLKVKPDDANAWLISTSNLVNLYLKEGTTYVLKAMRTITVNNKNIEEIKTTLKMQGEKYTSPNEVDKKLVKILSQYTTLKMMEGITLFTP